MYNPRDNRIAGWMDPDDLLFLYDLGCKYHTIMELGSWKGRSTHALLSGGAHVTAIDTWLGTPGDAWQERELGQDDVFALFHQNVGHFPNLTVRRETGMAAVNTFPDLHFDVCFIDAAHSYEDVKADILAWLPKCKHILCGHDYGNGHVGVKRAVDELFGTPAGVVDAIWWIDIRP